MCIFRRQLSGILWQNLTRSDLKIPFVSRDGNCRAQLKRMHISWKVISLWQRFLHWECMRVNSLDDLNKYGINTKNTISESMEHTQHRTWHHKMRYHTILANYSQPNLPSVRTYIPDSLKTTCTTRWPRNSLHPRSSLTESVIKRLCHIIDHKTFLQSPCTALTAGICLPLGLC